MRAEKNLTLKIDAQVLLWARMRALRDGTSINRRIRRYLEEYAAIPPDKRWPRVGAPATCDEARDQEAGSDAPALARAPPGWPDADPGPAGRPGAPFDHAELWGRDGHRVATSGEALIRSQLRHYRRLHRARG